MNPGTPVTVRATGQCGMVEAVARSRFNGRAVLRVRFADGSCGWFGVYELRKLSDRLTGSTSS